MGEVPCLINGRPSVLAGNLDLWHLRDESMGALEASTPRGLDLAVGARCAHSWCGVFHGRGCAIVKDCWHPSFAWPHQRISSMWPGWPSSMLGSGNSTCKTITYPIVVIVECASKRQVVGLTGELAIPRPTA